MTFSLAINHTPWVPERVEAMAAMRKALAVGPGYCRTLINDTDYRGTDWQVSKVKWALDQWRWAAAVDHVTHHVFMTDALHIMPRFWDALSAMCFNSGEAPIGLLSNHPGAVALEAAGQHWYRTNSWLVGPCYVLPHAFLLRFLKWFEAKPDGNAVGAKGYANDDSSINEFVTSEGGYTLHPLPTIIEHRADIGSTVGHGDQHSLERVSWRALQWPGVGGAWQRIPHEPVRALCEPAWWAGAADSPLMKVGE